MEAWTGVHVTASLDIAENDELESAIAAEEAAVAGCLGDHVLISATHRCAAEVRIQLPDREARPVAVAGGGHDKFAQVRSRLGGIGGPIRPGDRIRFGPLFAC